MELEGKCVVVVGLGTSGLAAARLCLGRGARVIGTDAKPRGELPAEASELGIELCAGGHEGVDWLGADLVVVSPGVPPLGALERAERAGIEVIGELELGCRFVQAPILCVGGTNGKSTVTTLLGDLLQAAGQTVFCGGNLGRPLAGAAGAPFDAAVVEVSSFQLERAPSFHPVVGILLNITEDHLDRYPSFQAYARAKGNAFAQQEPGDLAIVPAGDSLCEAEARRGLGRLVRFGNGGDYEVRGQLVVEVATGETFDAGSASLNGAHNVSNAAAAIAAARSRGATADQIREGLRAFRPLPHRMALAAQFEGIAFYDDSKGTNVGASVTALDGVLESRAVLIAGGRDKLGSYEPLAAALARKGRAAVLIGEAADRIEAAVCHVLPVRRAASIVEAVQAAFELARPGDAVLLSPACSSFDMFDSYADRGNQFVAAVQALVRERTGKVRP
ncbi:MAG: UDP-N-acetylmuramoyl-L-alanine--D-glutamate ligase [Polyangiaceae bacterium]|nr:UDP-N-acetylmuramoyl-L-alanine--D-glutamate ligase [Polyangiaceae bacterium]